MKRLHRSSPLIDRRKKLRENALMIAERVNRDFVDKPSTVWQPQLNLMKITTDDVLFLATALYSIDPNFPTRAMAISLDLDIPMEEASMVVQENPIAGFGNYTSSGRRAFDDNMTEEFAFYESKFCPDARNYSWYGAHRLFCELRNSIEYTHPNEEFVPLGKQEHDDDESVTMFRFDCHNMLEFYLEWRVTDQWMEHIRQDPNRVIRVPGSGRVGKFRSNITIMMSGTGLVIASCKSNKQFLFYSKIQL